MRGDEDVDARVTDPVLQMSEIDTAKKKTKKKKKQTDEAVDASSSATAASSTPAEETPAAPRAVQQPEEVPALAAAPGVNNAMHAPTGRYVQVADAAAGGGEQPPRPRYTPEQLAEIQRRLEEQEEAEDLRHYTKQINLIFRPVMLCIALVVWWVKVEQQNIVNSVSVGLLFTDSVTTGEAISDGLINALIIIGVVIVVTIIFVILFVKGYIKFIYGYLVFATGLLLGGTGGLFFWLQCDSLGVPLDFITLAFVCWNFAVVGLVSVFWHTPLLLRQFYLVMVSALLAWSLTKIEEWTTWFLLALLVLWDLFAVLTPCGPLRMLVESSQRQNQEIPALLYSVTMIFFMADAPDGKRAATPLENGAAANTAAVTAAPSSSTSSSPLLTRLDDAATPPPPALSPSGQLRSPASPPPPQQQLEEIDEEEEERRGLKLGLGDFVFYSVLVARAALSDWTTVVACICSVITGLMSTILLLAMFKRALPALPISLALGIMFYFVTSIVMTPYVVNNVTVLVHV